MAALDVPNILSKATALSLDQIRTLLEGPTLKGQTTIGEALAERDFSTADDLVADLCREMGLEFIKDIPVNDIPVDLIRNLPINYAKTNSILPFREEQDVVTALTANPVNQKVLDDLRVLFGKRIKPLVSTTAKIQDAINKVYEKSTANLAGSMILKMRITISMIQSWIFWKQEMTMLR